VYPFPERSATQIYRWILEKTRENLVDLLFSSLSSVFYRFP